MKRIVITLALTAAILLTSVAAFCDKQTFISNARTAYQSYRDAEPLFRQLGIPTTRLLQVAGIANDLVAAFEQNQNELAIDIVATLITRTNEIIANDVSLIKDEGRRIQVMAVLALSNIALHWIANNLIKVAQPIVAQAKRAGSRSEAAIKADAHAGALQTIRDFASAPAWGPAYAHAR